jgi:Cys-tRNA(Pro)/Cys-tRNA(Cys) deacylase
MDQNYMEAAVPAVNNVTRFLDSRKVSYKVFELPPEKYAALDVARLLDLEPASVLKTIVVTRSKPGKPLLVVIPAPASVDLKKLASAVGKKKVHLPTEREAEQLTDLQSGGISPLALINKGFQVVIDNSAKKYPEIYISGGQRGLSIRLPVDDLARLTRARFAFVCTSFP